LNFLTFTAFETLPGSDDMLFRCMRFVPSSFATKTGTAVMPDNTIYGSGFLFTFFWE
jgi:hypothetical protein